MYEKSKYKLNKRLATTMKPKNSTITINRSKVRRNKPKHDCKFKLKANPDGQSVMGICVQVYEPMVFWQVDV